MDRKCGAAGPGKADLGRSSDLTTLAGNQFDGEGFLASRRQLIHAPSQAICSRLGGGNGSNQTNIAGEKGINRQLIHGRGTSILDDQIDLTFLSHIEFATLDPFQCHLSSHWTGRRCDRDRGRRDRSGFGSHGSPDSRQHGGSLFRADGFHSGGRTGIFAKFGSRHFGCGVVKFGKRRGALGTSVRTHWLQILRFPCRLIIAHLRDAPG